MTPEQLADKAADAYHLSFGFENSTERTRFIDGYTACQREGDQRVTDMLTDLRNTILCPVSGTTNADTLLGIINDYLNGIPALGAQPEEGE